MDIQTAKQIRIADYLHSLGYSPVKQQGVNLWYKSPLREEAEASFKVNTEREQWYDFGLGKGGGIIELAAHLYATDHVPYILKRIAPVSVYPGENELESLVANALVVLRGTIVPKVYA